MKKIGLPPLARTMSAFFLAYSVNTVLSCRMDRALAAIHHDGGVVQLVGLLKMMLLLSSKE